MFTPRPIVPLDLSHFGLGLIFLAMSSVLLLAGPLEAQEPKINQDEKLVPQYTLPDPLVTTDGRRVTDRKMWETVRRPELLRLFEAEMYGKSPGPPPDLHFLVKSEDRGALNGLATRREVCIFLAHKPDALRIDLLLYLPNKAEGPYPTFLAMNFGGNQAIQNDPNIAITRSWVTDDPKAGHLEHRATEASRGSEATRWPIAKIIERGYAVATCYYGDVDPDFDDGFKNGVHDMYEKSNDVPRPPDAWGSLAAWAWGMSRAMDYLEKCPEIDAARVALQGHSRLGKAALWAGAQDRRFALVISNESGEGGAALARRKFGETVFRINKSFPHWFCGNFKKYNDREDDLPFDQHELLALIAPRPLLVCSAAEDLWADPRGEFLSALGADPVYRLLGTDGLGMQAMPGTNQPILSTIGYHVRPGKHDVTNVDWDVYLQFADRHLPRKP